MKLIEIINKETTNWVCVLFANSKEDVSEGIELPEGIELGIGSIVYTADADVGILDNSNTWRWK